MNRIKIQYKLETFVGEIFIIFCTIFYTCGQNGSEMSRLMSVKYTGPTDFILRMDELKMEKIAASETRKWYFPLQNDDKQFCVVVSSNQTNIKWILYFRDRKDVGPLSSSTGAVLFNYTLQKGTGYFSDYSRLGLYTVEIVATDDAWVSLFLAKENYEATRSLMNIVDRTEKPRSLKVKLDIKNNGCIIGWPQIWEPYNLDLFIIVSSKKYYSFLPDVNHGIISRDRGDSEKFFLYRNVTLLTSTTVSNLQPEEIYYITLLAANRAKFSVVFARTSFKFQKMKPLGLKDGKLVKKSLKRNGGRLSFKYKVSHQRLLNFSGPLIWYVSRCSGKIWVKIKHKKKLIEERLVSKYEIFAVHNLEPDHRYVMKITDASRDQNLEFDDVEVLASMRSHLYPILQAPRSLKVDFRSSRKTSIINWRPVSSDEPIQYCLYTKEIDLAELTKSSFDNMKIANQCNFNETKAALKYHHRYCNIHKSSKSKPFRHLRSRIQNHDRDLAVQITAEKLNNKITVIYDLFIIPNRREN